VEYNLTSHSSLEEHYFASIAQVEHVQLALGQICQETLVDALATYFCSKSSLKLDI
jgi:hypothetical protein